jgi:hypothetical protein
VSDEGTGGVPVGGAPAGSAGAPPAPFLRSAVNLFLAGTFFALNAVWEGGL